MTTTETPNGRGRRAPDIAEAILDSGQRFAQDAGRRLYWFDGSVYRPYGDEYVRKAVRDITESDEWTRRLAEEAVEYIRVDAPHLWERPPLGEINVRNGILSVSTRQLRPHDPDFLCSVQLPVTFDAAATCLAWERQVVETFPEDAAQSGVAWEIVAWLMMPDTRIQKALLLLGEGGTGKSTFLKALTAFLGEMNISNLPLHKLETERFSAARLVGKLANICADLPSTHLETSSMFKAITGGDRIAGEYKYGTGFDFTPFARLVFSANQPPRSGDASNAFYQRWTVLPFDRVFRGTRKELDASKLDALLAATHELSGVLNHALQVLPRIRESGLTEKDSMREAAASFRAVTDPVAIWLDRNTVDEPNAVTPKLELMLAFNRDAERRGRPVMTEKAFGSALRQQRPNLVERQRTIDGQRKWCWLGIRLRAVEVREAAAEQASAAPA
jgi:putative DNA primase/helicase